MKIISGGQTGVDQAALRAATATSLELGGWCPPGRTCETGLIPAEFPLQETPQDASPGAPQIARSQRTEWNVRDADATLILRRLTPLPAAGSDPGTTWTFECAVLYGKPLLLCDPSDLDQAKARMVCQWLATHGVRILNVAGPSEQTQPGIGQLAEIFLLSVFAFLDKPEWKR